MQLGSPMPQLVSRAERSKLAASVRSQVFLTLLQGWLMDGRKRKRSSRPSSMPSCSSSPLSSSCQAMRCVCVHTLHSSGGNLKRPMQVLSPCVGNLVADSYTMLPACR